MTKTSITTIYLMISCKPSWSTNNQNSNISNQPDTKSNKTCQAWSNPAISWNWWTCITMSTLILWSIEFQKFKIPCCYCNMLRLMRGFIRFVTCLRSGIKGCREPFTIELTVSACTWCWLPTCKEPRFFQTYRHNLKTPSKSSAIKSKP